MPAKLQAFQDQFARYLRDPSHQKRPTGITSKAGQRYAGLVFNNICAALDRCFPVARAVVGPVRWQRLCRAFFRDHPARTPFFSQLPKALVDYAASPACRQRLPAWFSELLHYEWLELAIETDPTPCDLPHTSRRTSGLRVNQTLHVLHYHWPLHRISPQYRPRKPCPYYCLAFRTRDDHVRFIEVNELTAQVVTELMASPQSADALLTAIADRLQVTEVELFIHHGRSMLTQLISQQALFQG